MKIKKELVNMQEKVDVLTADYNRLQRKVGLLQKQVETNERKNELIHGVGKVFTLEEKAARFYHDNTKLLNNVSVKQAAPNDTFMLDFYGVNYLLKVKKLAYAKSNLCELVSVEYTKGVHKYAEN